MDLEKNSSIDELELLAVILWLISSDFICTESILEYRPPSIRIPDKKEPM